MEAVIARWILGIGLGGFGLWITGLQLSAIVSRKGGSLAPLIGGGSLCAAMWLMPPAVLHRYSWIPLLVDPGCAFSVLMFIVELVRPGSALRSAFVKERPENLRPWALQSADIE